MQVGAGGIVSAGADDVNPSGAPATEQLPLASAHVCMVCVCARMVTRNYVQRSYANVIGMLISLALLTAVAVYLCVHVLCVIRFASAAAAATLYTGNG